MALTSAEILKLSRAACRMIERTAEVYNRVIAG